MGLNLDNILLREGNVHQVNYAFILKKFYFQKNVLFLQDFVLIVHICINFDIFQFGGKTGMGPPT